MYYKKMSLLSYLLCLRLDFNLVLWKQEFFFRFRLVGNLQTTPNRSTAAQNMTQGIVKLMCPTFDGYPCFAVNALRPRQNGRHVADDTFKRNISNGKVRISLKISLKFVPKGLVNYIPTLVQIMAWRRPGAKSLSEPMLVRLPTDAYMCRSPLMS